MANQNSAALHAHRFIASVNNGHFILQPPLNYQVVAQNIRAADVLSQHDIVNPQLIEPQERGLPHVVRHNGQSNAQRQRAYRARQNPQRANNRRANDARRVAARRADNLPFHNFARRDIFPDLNNIGPMTSVCEHCLALKFEDEKSFKCCHGGKVSLANLEPYPQELSDLMLEDTAQGKNFRANIRQFNSAFSFASFGANIAPPPGRGPPCFRLCGQVVHRSGTLHPEHGFPPSYSQLYIYDGQRALDERMNRNENRNCHPDVMRTIQNVMHRDNPYALAFKHMSEVEQEEHLIAAAENRLPSEVQMYMKVAGDRRRYNLPHHDEVAAVFVGEDGAPPTSRDIMVYPRNRYLETISTTSPNLDPMVYPIFFPRGDGGWHIGIPHVRERATARRNNCTMLQYYTYRLAIREHFCPIHYGKKLFQQYVVDAYCKVEGQRLDYIKKNQGALRVDRYQGLMDHLNSRADARGLQPGRMVILPSSFPGSPRAMHQHYQDAMAMISKYGKPDLFLTFTCNPKWAEITENLRPGEKAFERPDLVSRVFNMKLKELLKDINERGVLGKTVSHVYVIEFQKRSLPHCHLLIHLHPDDKIRNSADIDTLISAEIPDEVQEPELYNIIKSCMVHGPCGHLNQSSPCMVDGSCSKKFPKQFCQNTVASDNGYPKYRRRDNGRTVSVKNVDLDNRWIVPYNAWLSKKYNAHINLEACMSVKSVKYLYKYIYKGHDAANIEIRERLDHDEVKTYLDARYVSAPEAIWRLFEYNMHHQSHTVIRLGLHLPNYQAVYFQAGEEELALENAVENDTHLTAWFKLNRENQHAQQFLYPEIPCHFVFDQKNKIWKTRQRGAGKVISRMYSARPNEGERFFLRLLLLHTPGATSFEDLRTVDGVLLETFREACASRGLLQDDAEWQNVLVEAAGFQMPKQLRQLFAIILTHCEPSDPLSLWTAHKDVLCEDYARRMSQAQAEQATLAVIDAVIRQCGKSLADYNLPALDQLPADEDDDFMLQAGQALQVRPQLNPDQLHVADTVISAVTNVQNGLEQDTRIFYLDGPAGTGKTFTYNYLIAELRGRRIQVATAAWTGIAATLLMQGSTLHSLFRLPVPILETSSCNVTPVSKHADMLRQKSLFLFDEASMIPTHAFHAIDRLLRDICNNNTPFGGKVILLGGDFRQVLPVVRKGRPAEVVEVCLKSSPLWHLVSKFSLVQNMRARAEEQQFAEWLLHIGNGSVPLKQDAPFQDTIQIPDCCVLDEQSSMVQSMYGGLAEQDFASTAILTPTNDDSLTINGHVLELLPGEVVSYYSADDIETDDELERAQYPVEFLNSITPSGMPPHCLKFKIGAIVMLLRNLDLKQGLCNGTRLVIRQLHNNVIDAEVLTGVAVGNRVLIPRLQLAPSDTGMPFTLRRRQFPLRLAYSMTINKAQGQTFEKVGLYLQRPCFSHGQLYVAFSRARAFNDVKVKVVETPRQGYCQGKCYTTNVVYPQVL